MNELENYTKKLNEFENNIKDKSQLFKHILKLSNELKSEYQIAEFEGNEEKITQINNYLSALLFSNEKEEEVQNYVGVYNEMNQKQKDKVCKYLYEYFSVFNDREQEILRFKNDIVFKDYVKLTFISLFYL